MVISPLKVKTIYFTRSSRTMYMNILRIYISHLVELNFVHYEKQRVFICFDDFDNKILTFLCILLTKDK